MSFDLIEKSIGELSTYLKRGVAPKYCEEDGLLVINQRCIRDQVLTLDDARLHNVSKKSVSEEKYVQKYDVLVNSTGVGTLGRVAQVEIDLEATVDTHVTIVRPNEEIVDPHYFGFLMRSIQHRIERLASGSTGQTELRRTALSDISVQIIDDLDIQNDIASQLTVLDQKIHLNQQTNETLEAMAQAIFKSWFVDFDPVRAKIEAASAGRDTNRAAMAAIAGIYLDQDWDTIEAALQQKLGHMSDEQRTQLRQTAELFPDELVESEIGEVPKGWELSTLEDYITLSYGKGLRKKDRKEGSVPVYGSGGLTGNHNESLIDGPGIIVGRKGTVGSIYWEDEDFWPIDTVFYVEPKNEIDLSFYYYLLNTLGLEEMNTDAAVPGLNRNNAYRLKIPSFPDELMNLFADFTSDIHRMISSKKEETNTLENLRDTLLPKLISGEINIEKVTSN